MDTPPDIAPELLDTLAYSLLDPDDRTNYEWDTELEMYYLKPQLDKFLWDSSNFEPVP
jgi:hypothetical protein